MAVRGTFAIIFEGAVSKPTALIDDTSTFSHTIRTEITDGIGANQANRGYRNSGTIADGANLDLRLAGSVLIDMNGDPVNWTDIRAIYLRNSLVTGPTIRLGGSATNRITGLFNGSTDFLDLRPQETLMRSYPAVNDVAVVSGSADILRLTNLGGGTAAFELLILGVGA